mgnify:CR=1 FL=1
MIKSNKTIALPPGATIKEQLDERSISQKEFAMRMEMSEKHISKLINGEVLLTTEMALKLEMVLGIPAKFWLNLEAIYREKLVRIELENNMESDYEYATKFPYKKMAALNWIPKTTSKNEQVANLRKFFEVSRLGLLFENDKINIFCRKMLKSEKSDYYLMAWAQKAKLEARNIETAKINIDGIKESLNKFRKMTLNPPQYFCKELKDELAKNGVALVLLPHIEGSFLHGATFYDKNKIVLGLTARGKDADKFWFSFFHEIGHIILGHLNQNYYVQMEDEANLFSRNTLIPVDEYNKFTNKNEFSERSIIEFSNKINIDFGIVVGRLQKDNYIPYTKYNNLKTKYIIE